MSTEEKEAVHLPTLERETLEGKAYRALRDAILAGDVAEGQRLVQDVLAERLGVSRIPVRQALKQLALEGLVTVNERGAYFASGFTVDDAREVYRLRALLEPYACRLALERIAPSGVERLEEIAEAMRAAAKRRDRDRYVSLNREFHMVLYELSDCRRLIRFIESLWSGTPPLTPILLGDQLARSELEHRHILEAIRAGDVDAAVERLREHIEHAGQALVEKLRSGDRR